MTYYYYTDGKERFGPFTIDQLKDRIITPETLVWKEGMSDWSPAKYLRDLDEIFYTSPYTSTGLPEIRNYDNEKPPKTWLVESILVTMFCCPFIFGIMGILQSSKVETLWLRGDRIGARDASREAAMWLRIGLIVSLVIYGLFLMLVMINVSAFRSMGGYPA